MTGSRTGFWLGPGGEPGALFRGDSNSGSSPPLPSVPVGASPAPHTPCSHRATLSLGGAARAVREKSKGGAPRTGQCEARCLQVP